MVEGCVAIPPKGTRHTLVGQGVLVGSFSDWHEKRKNPKATFLNLFI